VNEGDVLDTEATVAPANEEGRHLSWFRVFLVVAVVAAAAGGGWYWFRQQEEAAVAAIGPPSWFAPYVDVTSTPSYAFEDATSASAVLAFIVSAKDNPCDPSWGGVYSMDQAADQLDLDRRVARLRQLGGTVSVSFGGAANSELAIGCTDVAALTAAYASVVDRYDLTDIDLDIEGQASMTNEVNQRRAQAIAALVAQRQAAGKNLDVWLTLPVISTGLTTEGQAVVSSMLAGGARPAGINAMTMDYGEPFPEGRTMAQQGELALTALQQQIQDAWSAAGLDLSDSQAWNLIGATPMIGQNDIPAEVFSLDDANQTVAFAQQHKLSRLSMWSANRDQSCGPNYPDVKVVSDVCSGIEQQPGAFGAIFVQFGSGQARASTTDAPTTGTTAPAPTSTGAGQPARATTSEIVDDPASSPYQIWNENQGYPKGTKVVWHKNVYQAKWYTQGDQPDLPVASANQSPWSLIGPVLPGDTPVPTPTLPAGTYPEWSPTDVYVAGSRVLHDGIGWQARFWSQGDVPGAPPTSPDKPSPWELITQPN
jgi:chitinase